MFDPILPPATFVSPCYAYRGKADGESDQAYAARLAAELEDTILRLGPSTVSAFVAETVVGSTSGAVPPVPGYFAGIRAVCDRYGVLLVLDEVMAGMGRTGHRFAYLADGVRPDVVAVGKGLAAGYQPLSAMLVAAPVLEAIRGGSGVLRNGQTFVHHALACAAGLAVQRTIDDEGRLDNVRRRGTQLRAMLRDRLAQAPYAGDVRGRGLFVGVELVADRDTKASGSRVDRRGSPRPAGRCPTGRCGCSRAARPCSASARAVTPPPCPRGCGRRTRRAGRG